MIQTAEQRQRDAQRIIEDFTLAATLTTFSPTALINGMVSSLTILYMVEQLSELYNIPYSEQLGKGLIAAVILGIHSSWTTFLMTKVAPFVGLFAAGAPSALLNGALTYAIGKTLVDHYETGGTLRNFDPQHAHVYWQKRLKRK